MLTNASIRDAYPDATIYRIDPAPNAKQLYAHDPKLRLVETDSLPALLRKGIIQASSINILTAQGVFSRMNDAAIQETLQACYTTLSGPVDCIDGNGGGVAIIGMEVKAHPNSAGVEDDVNRKTVPEIRLMLEQARLTITQIEHKQIYKEADGRNVERVTVIDPHNDRFLGDMLPPPLPPGVSGGSHSIILTLKHYRDPSQGLPG